MEHNGMGLGLHGYGMELFATGICFLQGVHYLGSGSALTKYETRMNYFK